MTFSLQYEVTGDVPNVISPCGAVFVEENGELRLYYGAADTCVGLLTAPLSDLLAWLRTQPMP
ncbi:MAG: hypothetical protein EXR51_07120 [Dehalococcoidia bacterium]|nr:hypothetical protein [Dehalococcoidia bacterium]